MITPTDFAAKSIKDLNPGDFFAFHRNEIVEYGLVVKFNGEKGFIQLTENPEGKQSHCEMRHVDVAKNISLLHFNSAELCVLGTSSKSLLNGYNAENVIGAIILSDDKYYIVAKSGSFAPYYINLLDGMASRAFPDDNFITFLRWSIVIKRQNAIAEKLFEMNVAD